MIITPIHAPVVVPVRDHAHWTEIRYGTIGASESAALFESVANESPIEDSENDDFSFEENGEPVSPYSSPLSLWALKTRRVTAKHNGANNRTAWGTNLEPHIARLIAEKQGWQLRKVTDYYIHPRIARMGASLDYEIDVDGSGLMLPFEIKNVGADERWKWKNAVGEWVVPAHILIQVQHQLAVTGMPQAFIGVLFGGNEDRIFEVVRDDGMIAEIEAAVEEFWWYVDNDTQPEANIERDGWVIRRLYQHADPENVVDWADEDELKQLVAEMRHHSSQANAHKKEAERLRDLLLLRLGSAEAANLGDGSLLRAATVSGKEMPSYFREAYRVMRVVKERAKHSGRPVAQVLGDAAD